LVIDSLMGFIEMLGGRIASGRIIIDLIDIAVVAFLVSKILQFAVQTRAEQLLKGVVLVLLLYTVARWLNMTALNFIMSTVLQIGVLIIVILFQPEIRRALEQIGRSNVVGDSIKFLNKNAPVIAENERLRLVIDSVCRAATEFSLGKTGALIAFERETKLGEAIETGTTLDAEVSAELLMSLFAPNTSLHDGAVIISGGRVRAAGCVLPLSQNFEIGRELGTRHRAAIGLTEVSDAVVIVVSEESGRISFVDNGQMLRGLDAEELRKRLYDALAKKDGNHHGKHHKRGGIPRV